MLGKNERNIQNQGEGSINNTGDYVHIGDQYFFQPKFLNRTYLFDFCEIFINSDIEYGEYNTDVATDFDDKMEHNEIITYKIVFMECDYFLDDVELILNEFPHRQKVLSKIQKKYSTLKNTTTWDSKDALCEQIFEFLFETVENDSNSSSIVREDAELAIHSLMYYAFTKCKLLDPIT